MMSSNSGGMKEEKDFRPPSAPHHLSYTHRNHLNRLSARISS